MKQRPMPLILLSISFLLMPFLSLIFNSLIMEVSHWVYTQAYLKVTDPMMLVEFFLFSPVAAVCIYLMKPWSYVVALTLVFWQVLMNSLMWSQNYEGLGIFVSANAFLLFSFVYLNVPSVRRSFMNENLKWWKTKPRYKTAIGNLVTNNELNEKATISNLSENGALINNWEPHKVGEQLRISFSLGNYDFSKEVEVVHAHGDSCGVKFLGHNVMVKKALEEEGLTPLRKPASFSENMSEWLGEVKKGRGVFPPV